MAESPHGLRILIVMAMAIGCCVKITPLPNDRVRVVLDPAGLRLTWFGPIDGNDQEMSSLSQSHTAGDVDEEEGSVTFEPNRYYGVGAARASALGLLAQVLASSQACSALVVVSGSRVYLDGPSMVARGDTEHPELVGIARRVAELGEVADA